MREQGLVLVPAMCDIDVREPLSGFMRWVDRFLQ